MCNAYATDYWQQTADTAGCSRGRSGPLRGGQLGIPWDLWAAVRAADNAERLFANAAYITHTSGRLTSAVTGLKRRF
jgi:hypothetical protein